MDGMEDPTAALEQARVKQSGSVSMRDLHPDKELPTFKVGIIGCGQVGTVLLTKLLEVKD